MVGRHDGFPAHEIYKRIDNATAIRIYNHDPRLTGETPLSLFDPMEHEVNSLHKNSSKTQIADIATDASYFYF